MLTFRSIKPMAGPATVPGRSCGPISGAAFPLNVIRATIDVRAASGIADWRAADRACQAWGWLVRTDIAATRNRRPAI